MTKSGENSNKRHKVFGIGSAVLVCGFFLSISQISAKADTSTTQDDGYTATSGADTSASTLADSSAVVLQAQSTTSSAPANVESTSVQQSEVARASSASSSTNSSAITSASSASAAVHVTDLGSVDNSDAIETAKAAAEAEYAATGQPQTIVASMASAVSYQDAFLDSIKAGAIQGWVQYGVLPSVTAAQAICESAWGQSALATQGHNLFGIKGSYNGQSINMTTSEWGSGGYYSIVAAFRAYPDYASSILDHGNFLASNSRYANLIWNRDANSVANDLQADGYATSPTYASTLLSIVNSYNLRSWDSEAFAITDTVNTGNLDEGDVKGDNIVLRGWHVATDSKGKNNNFIIILDASNNHELARYQISSVARQDVYNVYSKVNNALNSGFELTIPYTSTFAGKTLTVISRYTSSSDGNSDYVDYSYNVNLNRNDANLENFSVDANGNLNVKGWHVADDSLGKEYHYLILLNSNTNREIARIKVDDENRNDVGAQYSDVYDSSYSGFSVTLDFTAAMANVPLTLISRYSDNASGEGDYVDYWFNSVTFNRNDANLEEFSVDADGNLNVKGWHAADASAGKQYHYVIIFDATKQREIARYLVPSEVRTDVGKVYGDVYNSSKSGFKLSTKLLSSMVGDNIQIISRYSDSADGEGNRVDYWFAPQTFTRNDANLETVSYKSNHLTVTGWHATDYATDKKYRFIIVFDKTQNKEITREAVDSIERTDVGKVYGDVYNSNQSGFGASIDLSNIVKGDEIQIISRYSNQANGEGKTADYWFAPIKLK